MSLVGASSDEQAVDVAANYFDGWIAERYSTLWAHPLRAARCRTRCGAAFRARRQGPVLELGIGTGRLALPLSQRGIPVHGIELSPAMVEQLRTQPRSDGIDVTIGDFATTRVAGTFTLVYLVRNTIMNLTSQDAQVECFHNVASHLEPGGFFVIEVVIPPWQRLPTGERVVPFDVSPEHLGFDEIDGASQRSVSHHYWFLEGETKRFSAPFRYVWPSELDLMGRLAGMRLQERWSGWNREPFTRLRRSRLRMAEARMSA
jgi:SAM-dependent methyltransferase